MSDNAEFRIPARFPLTLRQRRLRYLTYIVGGVIAVMIVVGFTHPFFNMTPSTALADPAHSLAPAALKSMRKAFAAKLLLTGVYWAVCILFTLLLPIFAWLYTREIQLQELMARRDIWRDVSGRNRASAEHIPDLESEGDTGRQSPGA